MKTQQEEAMIVKIKSNYIILITMALTLFLSCQIKCNEEKEEMNSYLVISETMKHILEQSLDKPTFPPPPTLSKFKFSKNDSLVEFMKYYKDVSKTKIVAINRKVFDPNLSLDMLRIKCSKAENIIDSSEFIVSRKNQFIDLKNVFISNKDSLIYYSDEHKKRTDNGFNDIDLHLEFSTIMFNESYTKSLLIINVRYERLDSFSTLIYLEKDGFYWKVKCKQMISIS